MKRRAALRNARSAFTLIEVMVATGILVILVLMVGGLFSQASDVWDSGYVRAEGGMVARAIVGSIQRDLQTAVDGRAFDGLGFGEHPVKSGGGSLEFVSLAPIDPTREKKDGDRGIRLVSYSVTKGSVKRTESLVKSAGVDRATGRAKWTKGASTSSTIYQGSDGSEGATGADEVSAANSSSFKVRDISLVFGDSEDAKSRSSFEKGSGHGDFAGNVAWGMGEPSWCRVRVEVLPKGSTTGLEVRSSGGGRGAITAH